MKRVLLRLTVLAAIVSSAHGQGTIAFGNSALTRVSIVTFCGDDLGPVTAAYGFNFYVFWGPAGATANELVQVNQPEPKASIGPTPGVMINAPSVFALPGTEAGQVVSLQIRAWNTQWRAETDVRQVTLGPTAGPGAVIWQTRSGTSPNRFYPMSVVLLSCIPEPTTLALGVLGGVALLSRWLMRK